VFLHACASTLFTDLSESQACGLGGLASLQPARGQQLGCKRGRSNRGHETPIVWRQQLGLVRQASEERHNRQRHRGCMKPKCDDSGRLRCGNETNGDAGAAAEDCMQLAQCQHSMAHAAGRKGMSVVSGHPRRTQHQCIPPTPALTMPAAVPIARERAHSSCPPNRNGGRATSSTPASDTTQPAAPRYLSGRQFVTQLSLLVGLPVCSACSHPAPAHMTRTRAAP
jgi:hypothetical protein